MTMKKLKYIICDLDGTLLNEERRISRRQGDYLCDLYKRKDIRFGFASGRAVTSLIPIAEEAGILEICDVMVANNGVDILDVKSGRKTETLMVSVEDIYTILELMKPFEWINVTFHNPNGLFGLYETPRIRQILEINHFDSLHSPYTEHFVPTPRVTLIFDPGRIDEVRRVVAGLKLPPWIQGVQSDKDIYDLARSGVSKAEGIRRYVSAFGDSMEEVLVFGDGENDLDMMRAAGVSVAMKNGSEEVRERADYVTERTNQEDGIMHFLKTAEDWF